jgi:formylglycine-generating enzyme required for sulfatase activity
MAYCRWLSVKSGQSVALLSEAQWVRAARGSSGLDFAWGSEWDSDSVNANFRLQRTSLVGLCPNGATSEGVQDMVGNVWVWCLDEHSVSPTGKTWRIVRGGAWNDITQDNGLCWQKCHISDYCHNDLGLRLVRTVPHSAL